LNCLILGAVGIVPKNYGEANLNQALARISLKDKEMTRYVAMFLVSSIPQEILHVLGSSRTVQPGLKMSDIKNIVIPLPQKKEREQIDSIIANFSQILIHLKSKKSKLEMIKKGLMQKLLTGKIRVKTN